jgi:predicted amidohydrolase
MISRASLTVAAAAYPPEALADLAAWRAKMERWLGEARDQGAELVIFPEYAAMELATMAGPDAAVQVASALAAVSERMAASGTIHQELARRFGLHIVAGSGPLIGADGRYRNVVRIFAPNGKYGVQEKLILTPWERAWGLAAGKRPRVFDTTLGRIGIAVCYDGEFPLNVRAQTEAGADLIAIPACTDTISGYSRVRTAALARALENQCATVLSSLSGAAPWCPAIDENVGAAGAYGPADHGVSETGVLREGTIGETGWVVTKIDLDAILATRLAGGVRTFTHWAEQSGARALAPFAEVVDLT